VSGVPEILGWIT